MRQFLICCLIFNILICGFYCFAGFALADAVKRDPFVALIDSSGRIKSEAELTQPPEAIFPVNINLKGIIWSLKAPLAVINNKIYREGAVVFEGLILEKINPDNIILNDRGEAVKIYLRKKESK